MNRAEMVERRAAPEVAAIDERHRQTTLRAVIGDCQPVDAAADDNHVERPRGEAAQIPLHRILIAVIPRAMATRDSIVACRG
jgi:hypothetical protein